MAYGAASLGLDGDCLVCPPVLHHLAESFVLFGGYYAVSHVDAELTNHIDGAVRQLFDAYAHGADTTLGVFDIDRFHKSTACRLDGVVVTLVAVAYFEGRLAARNQSGGVDIDAAAM